MGDERGKPYICNTHGYVMQAVRGKPRRQHRLIWEDHYGPIPKGMQIDHINGDRTDNRIENLRLATNQQNSSNREVGDFSNIDVRKAGYRVKISYKGKSHYFGTYSCLRAAQYVRDIARQQLNGDFNGRRKTERAQDTQ